VLPNLLIFDENLVVVVDDVVIYTFLWKIKNTEILAGLLYTEDYVYIFSHQCKEMQLVGRMT
jgi:hypothetical protein